MKFIPQHLKVCINPLIYWGWLKSLWQFGRRYQRWGQADMMKLIGCFRKLHFEVYLKIGSKFVCYGHESFKHYNSLAILIIVAKFRLVHYAAWQVTGPSVHRNPSNFHETRKACSVCPADWQCCRWSRATLDRCTVGVFHRLGWGAWRVIDIVWKQKRKKSNSAHPSRR
jgi:hypothetical protein